MLGSAELGHLKYCWNVFTTRSGLSIHPGKNSPLAQIQKATPKKCLIQMYTECVRSLDSSTTQQAGQKPCSTTLLKVKAVHQQPPYFPCKNTHIHYDLFLCFHPHLCIYSYRSFLPPSQVIYIKNKCRHLYTRVYARRKTMVSRAKALRPSSQPRPIEMAFNQGQACFKKLWYLNFVFWSKATLICPHRLFLGVGR